MDNIEHKNFLVRNLVGQELQLTISEELSTLEQLKCLVGVVWHVPEELQRYVSNGNVYNSVEDNSMNLSDILNLKHWNKDWDPVIHLIWMTDEDFIDLNGGGLIEASEVERKRQLAENRGRRSDLVSIRTYRTMFIKTKAAFSLYHNIHDLKYASN